MVYGQFVQLLVDRYQRGYIGLWSVCSVIGRQISERLLVYGQFVQLLVDRYQRGYWFMVSLFSYWCVSLCLCLRLSLCLSVFLSVAASQSLFVLRSRSVVPSCPDRQISERLYWVLVSLFSYWCQSLCFCLRLSPCLSVFLCLPVSCFQPVPVCPSLFLYLPSCTHRQISERLLVYGQFVQLLVRVSVSLPPSFPLSSCLLLPASTCLSFALSVSSLMHT